MTVVAIDTTKGVRKTVLLTNEQLAEIDDFRLHLRRVRGRLPSESAALAELIQDSLRRFREREQPERER